jgi:hypothetical protein
MKWTENNANAWAEDMDSVARRVAFHAAGGPRSIEQRLNELDGRYDIDGTVIRTVAVVGALGLVVGMARSRAWLLLPTAALLLIMAESLRPMALWLKRCGLRTHDDTRAERLALKTLRGDFRHLPGLTEGRDTETVKHILQEFY